MKENLIAIMEGEKKALQDLLKQLEDQHRFILANDAFNLESIVEKIRGASIEIAKYEMERRKLTGDASMSDVVNQFKDENLEKLFYEIRLLIEKNNTQKETNELLIKQSLVFVNKMLNYINPNRENKTYNAYGRMRR